MSDRTFYRLVALGLAAPVVFGIAFALWPEQRVAFFLPYLVGAAQHFRLTPEAESLNAPRQSGERCSAGWPEDSVQAFTLDGRRR